MGLKNVITTKNIAAMFKDVASVIVISVDMPSSSSPAIGSVYSVTDSLIFE